MSTSSPIRRSPLGSTLRSTVLLAAGLFTAVGVSAATGSDGNEPGPGVGTITAHFMREAALREARADFWVARATCLNISDPAERAECLGEARADLLDAIDEAWEQYEARLDLVDMLGEGPYDPEIDPADFTSTITNPYRPMIPGTTMVYNSVTEDGLEVIEVTVTDETKTIEGVECVVVQDTVTVEGELVEDTLDYFAQDLDGNLWYFGEIALNYEDGELTDIEGSWQAGVDGAKPGIIAFAAPVAGTTYRQEFLLGTAEDVAQVLDLDASATVPYGGTYTGCMETLDWSPLEPGVFEHKFYAPGIGVLLETDPDTGKRVELVDIIVN